MSWNAFQLNVWLQLSHAKCKEVAFVQLKLYELKSDEQQRALYINYRSSICQAVAPSGGAGHTKATPQDDVIYCMNELHHNCPTG
jgi:hypothetical protein